MNEQNERENTKGNEGGFFEMHDQTGELFLVREIDLESLSSSMLTLQIQVSRNREK